MMTTENRIPTNMRTMMILEVIGRHDHAMTATEINEHIGLPKQTVHRLVATLEEEGFLIRGPDGKRFRPSRRLRMMGAGLLHASQFHITRHQILQQISDAVQETVNFVIPEDTGMRYLDRVDADWPFRIQLPVGTNVPFHCTASGKAFMSTLSPKARERFVGALTLNELTTRTHVSAADLLDDLKVCAKRGYALDDGEFMEDMIAAAVPVLDLDGRFVAALAFHGPTQRISLDQAEARIAILIEGAKRLQDTFFV